VAGCSWFREKPDVAGCSWFREKPDVAGCSWFREKPDVAKVVCGFIRFLTKPATTKCGDFVS